MYETLEVAEQYRCFEDFDFRDSRQMTDFYRKLYHNRIKYLMYRLRDLRRIIPTATTGKNGIRLMRAKTLICILLTK